MAINRAFGAALLGFAMAATAVQAQDYPSQTIRLIVPFLAGGPVDALSRVVAQHLQSRLGQNVIVENRSGGGTTIGAKAVASGAARRAHAARHRPEHRLLPGAVSRSGFRSDQGARRRVATLVTWSHLIAVAPAVPANNIPELVSYAKANPGKLAFGFGLATMPHIVGVVFKQATGIDIIDVPYRGGEQARADLLGGRVHINIAPVPQLLQLIRDGKIRALAYTGPQRSPELPDVPTMTESGYPQVGFNPDVWMGILAPAGTPAAIVEKLNREVNAVLKSDEMAPALKRFGYEAKITTPAEFETFFAAELQKWPPILKATGLKPQ